MWHLACGQWMMTHGQVLGHDPFSIDPAPVWINVHWLFQLIVTALHKVGGWELLSVLKALLGSLAVVVPLWPMRKTAPAWLLGLVGLLILMVIVSRVRVRPEAFTLVLVGLTIAITDSARRDFKPARLWTIVPLMLLWVNMHGLFLLGLGIVWSSIAGDWLDRRTRPALAAGGNLANRQAVLAGGGSTLACLLTPWPLEVAAQPLLLWTRINGGIYTYAVSEFAPTYEALANQPFFIALAAVASIAMISRARHVPLAHFAWLGVFGLLGLTAVRNVGLAGPVFGYPAP
jgi:hypothetical protein